MRTRFLVFGGTCLILLSACDLFDGNSLRAEDDTAQTSPGQAVTIDVLANDDGDGLVYIESFDDTTAVGSTITSRYDTLDTVLKLVYTPADGFSGVDEFGYSIANATFRDSVLVVDSARVVVTVQ